MGPSTVGLLARVYAGTPHLASSTKTDEAKYVLGAAWCKMHSALPGANLCKCRNAATAHLRCCCPLHYLRHRFIRFRKGKEMGARGASSRPSSAWIAVTAPEASSARSCSSVSMESGPTVWRQARTLRMPFCQSSKFWLVRPMTYTSRQSTQRCARVSLQEQTDVPDTLLSVETRKVIFHVETSPR